MTGRLEAHLRARRDAGSKLLVPYVTGGVSDDWLEVVAAFDDAGADAIEVGIPFSDPVMDGPTIQEASERALARGTTPVQIFSELRRLDAEAPLVAMTYANLAFRMGYERFAAECEAAGLAGVIFPDVPMEELGEWEVAAGDRDVATVLLASPASPDERLARLVERSSGFVYGVNLLGVTGARSDLAETATTLAGRLKRITDLPVIMGLGISGPETARTAAAAADGVIVGSALMRRLLDGASLETVAGDVVALRAALDAL